MLDKNVSRKGFIKKSVALVTTGLIADAYFLGMSKLKAEDTEILKKEYEKGVYNNERGDLPKTSTTNTTTDKKYIIPGEVLVKKGDIDYNAGRQVTKIKVTNTGDRPVQIGSHFHFFEVNRKLNFKRSEAFGKHLNLIASTAVRFEPGEEKEVELVPFAGKKIFIGANNLVDGPLNNENKVKALAKAKKLGFLGC